MPYEDETLDIRGAAKFLGVHEQTIRRLARKAEIPSYRVGRSWRFSKAALHNWTASQWRQRLPKNVLVVDDEPGIREIVRQTLEPEGYGITTAADGNEALESVRRAVPDMVLLDLKLPDISGVEVLRRIREDHGNVPVIILTGYPDSDMMQRALEYSPITLLAKPVKPAQILDTVRSFFEHRVAVS